MIEVKRMAKKWKIWNEEEEVVKLEAESKEASPRKIP